jgi:hypothetical protein
MLAFTWTVIANEDNERALQPAHVAKCPDFSIHTLKREVVGLPAEVANAVFG